jgi:hypothetical protein
MEPLDEEVVVFLKKNQTDNEAFLKGGIGPHWTINFSNLSQKALAKHIRRFFKSVRESDIDGTADISAFAEVTEFRTDWHAGFSPAVSLDLQLILVFSIAEEPFRKNVRLSIKDHAYNSQADTVAISMSLLDKGVGKAIDELSSDSQFVAFLDNVNTQKTSLTTLLADLKPLSATYRVTESGAVVRKKPDSKAGAVKKIGVGSQIQVIGQLPSGWLQVAKEGEAIGWVHSGSVTAFSVQSESKVIAASSQQPVTPIPVSVASVQPVATTESFPGKPVAVTFPRGKPNPDDIAVIIGNANYKATAKDIPDVVPAYADAEGMKRYAAQALGIKEENIIFIKDGRLTDFVATFGNESNYKGKLFNWVKAGKSNVFVYYSGHGAPSADGSSSYLVPVDAQASLIDLSAYPLRTLYANLAKLPAASVTVVLESCFSGSSQSGTVIKNASPVFQKALQETVPPNLTVISAASGTQIASWEQDKSSGLFTKYFLLGMAGAADKKPYGNGDGKVTNEELGRYLAETVSYSAQRYYGREQTAQVAVGGGK